MSVQQCLKHRTESIEGSHSCPIAPVEFPPEELTGPPSTVRSLRRVYVAQVKAVIDTALSETDAPLAVGDLKRGAGLSVSDITLRLGVPTASPFIRVLLVVHSRIVPCLRC